MTEPVTTGRGDRVASVDETAPLGVLYPAVAEAAHRAGASGVGLVDVGGPDTNLQLDRARIAYDDGRRLGEASAPVQVSVSLRGHRPVPARVLPEVVSRVSIDAAAPGLLAEALATVPAGALPVVMTTWALSRLTLDSRLRFLQHLVAAATARSVAWVSVEGVGVAPAVPTLGDRPASGHSIVGVAVLRHAALHVEAVGRCWSRGRYLAWLAGSTPPPSRSRAR